MHKEILTPAQTALLPLIESFSKDFGLVGGTAIAFHLGHRESIDFDLFSMEEFSNVTLARKVESTQPITRTLVNRKGEFTFLLGEVKVTFFQYPFAISYDTTLDGTSIRLPSLLTLAAMKAYALGMRAKWKDYVDLYFIFKDHHPIEEVMARTEELFGDHFNAKIFRAQLAYFEDVNYTEQVVFRPGFETDDVVIKRALEEYSLAQ